MRTIFGITLTGVLALALLICLPYVATPQIPQPTAPIQPGEAVNEAGITGYYFYAAECPASMSLYCFWTVPRVMGFFRSSDPSATIIRLVLTTTRDPLTIIIPAYRDAFSAAIMELPTGVKPVALTVEVYGQPLAALSRSLNEAAVH